MARKCYISFKTEDLHYKQHIQNHLSVDMIDRSLDSPIQSTDDDYVLRKIREDYLADSTVTIHLIGAFSGENRGAYEQRFIKRELQASLYHGSWNTRSGILGVVLPPAQSAIYRGSYTCSTCGGSHTFVAVNDATTVKEFSYNFYIPNGKCSHTEDERYCVMIPWEGFCATPDAFVERAFVKRDQPVADKVRVYGG